MEATQESQRDTLRWSGEWSGDNLLLAGMLSRDMGSGSQAREEEEQREEGKVTSHLVLPGEISQGSLSQPWFPSGRSLERLRGTLAKEDLVKKKEEEEDLVNKSIL